MRKRPSLEHRLKRIAILSFVTLGGWSLKHSFLTEDMSRLRQAVEHAGQMDNVDLFADFPEIRTLAYYRWCLGSGHAPRRFLSALFQFFFPGQTNLYLWCDKIGPGFLPFHAFATVVAAKEIGRNVTIFQGVTVGHKGAGKCPTIGDNVTIGANACVLGDISIGDGVTIGAGSIVLSDVPPGWVVAGNPAKKIRSSANDLIPLEASTPVSDLK